MEDKNTTPKKKRIKKTTPITSAKPVLGKDNNILNDYKNGVNMDIICARYMVHRAHVERLVEKYG